MGSAGTTASRDVDSVAADPIAAAGNRLGRLTPRELQVLALMADGLSNQAISTRLALSRRTIESYVRTIFTGLGLLPEPASDRRVLAVLAFLSLLPREPNATTGVSQTPATSLRPTLESTLESASDKPLESTFSPTLESSCQADAARLTSGSM
ncbi:MAG: helix-turn-helix domain-containing protein [Acidimicrobiales bacterium]